jgi:hypothetical protein
MKDLKAHNETSLQLKNFRELTLEEVEQIAGGVAGDELQHGRGCGCMACRIVNNGPTMVQQ